VLFSRGLFAMVAAGAGASHSHRHHHRRRRGRHHCITFTMTIELSEQELEDRFFQLFQRLELVRESSPHQFLDLE
jgi:hypothetical protein